MCRSRPQRNLRGSRNTRRGEPIEPHPAVCGQAPSGVDTALQGTCEWETLNCRTDQEANSRGQEPRVKVTAIEGMSGAT